MFGPFPAKSCMLLRTYTTYGRAPGRPLSPPPPPPDRGSQTLYIQWTSLWVPYVFSRWRDDRVTNYSPIYWKDCQSYLTGISGRTKSLVNPYLNKSTLRNQNSNSRTFLKPWTSHPLPCVNDMSVTFSPLRLIFKELTPKKSKECATTKTYIFCP